MPRDSFDSEDHHPTEERAVGVSDLNNGDLEREMHERKMGEGEDTMMEEEEDAGSMCSRANFLIALPNILIPILYGYQIGYVGVYSTMNSWAMDCSLYKAEKPCTTLSNAKCSWTYYTPGDVNYPGLPNGGYACGWQSKETCYAKYVTEASCQSSNDCTWNYQKSTCGNKVGYTSIFSGLFAGAMIIGAMFGSLLGGVMTKKLDYRMSFLLVGVISLVGCILQHVTTGIFEYWLLFVARIILGFAMGWQAIAAPSYIDVFSPKKYVKVFGTFFQVFTAFGSFVAAIIGIILGETISYSADRDANIMGRMQGFTCFPTLFSIMVIFLPLCTRNRRGSKTKYEDEEQCDDEAVATGHHEKQYTIGEMIGPLLIGVAMGCTLQLTGINANMNYAPTIMTNLGLAPLVGNIIVLGWNSITAFGAIPLSQYFSMRTLFLFFTVMGSLCCLFLSGIPVYPGVTKVKKAKEGIAITGIALFILAYEFGIGPCFFVLAVDVFPPSFRPIGSSVTTGVMFILNLIINICYPIATEGMSGGPSGNQDKGQAIAFIFFGCIGLVTVTIEYFFLHPWEEPTDEAAE